MRHDHTVSDLCESDDLEARYPDLLDPKSPYQSAALMIQSIAVDLTVLAAPTPQYPAENLTAQTRADHAHIVLVNPAVHGDITSDGFSRSYDRVWYHKNLIHECTAAFMWLYEPPAPRWQLQQAPAWFIEGLQEFVAIERGPNEARELYRARYLPRLHASTVSPLFERVDEKYADGFLIVLFLHEEFGSRPVHDVLNRRHEGFWASLERSLGEARPRLFERWSAWRSRNQPAPRGCPSSC